ncbi:MAG TPA: DUF167 family protein [Gemmatimonadaceae bacterium]|nr:DUF167 family protein [Gemmatimonadaceae bacterium]
MSAHARRTLLDPAARALVVQTHGDGVRFSVRVQPRAARAGVSGVHAGALTVRLTAPPVDGAANAALVALLAELLQVPRGAVQIRSGTTARTKLIDVRGVDAARVHALLSTTST